MTTPDLCPHCLDELPADYPYDHVAVDKAVAGDTRIFRAMTRDEQREVIRTGRARGLTITALSVKLGRSTTDLHDLMGEPVGEDDDERRALNERITQLWQAQLTDADIGLRTGLHPGSVQKIRTRLKLPAHRGPGGRLRRGLQETAPSLPTTSLAPREFANAHPSPRPTQER